MSVNFRFDLVPARTDASGVCLNPAAYTCPAGMNSFVACSSSYQSKLTPTQLRYASRRAANFATPHVVLASQYKLEQRDYLPYAVFPLLSGEF